jgi:formylglycine-generating enzyme required for sulfatase activity
MLGDWAALLQPVRGHLVQPLTHRLVEADAGGFPSFLAVLSVYPDEAAAELHGHLQRTVPAAASLEEKQALAQQQAQTAVALLRLGRTERAWPRFHQDTDPTCRTYLIHRCAALRVDPALLARRLLSDAEQDPSVRQGLLLALGEYGAELRADVVRGPLVERLLREYRDEPDPGMHAATAWLLRQWAMAERLARLEQELPRAGAGRPVTKPRWEVNGQGQTFAVLPAPGAFEIGSPGDEKGKFGQDEDRRRVQLDYPFAVALRLVTVTEFLNSRPDFKQEWKQYSPGPDTPINWVTWYDAARYCNWLSEQEQIPKEQWCYEPNAKEEYAEGMKVKANYQRLRGYRLPREAEWEYACRAGTMTAWAYGSDEALLPNYAWFAGNAGGTMHAVATKKPNGLGLFDMHGNAWEWCQEVYGDKDIEDVNSKTSRVLRGGSFSSGAWFARAACRNGGVPATRIFYVGFRVARTYN